MIGNERILQATAELCVYCLRQALLSKTLTLICVCRSYCNIRLYPSWRSRARANCFHPRPRYMRPLSGTEITSSFHRARTCSSSRQSSSLPRSPTALAISVGSNCAHNDRHSQICGVIHSKWQTPLDQIWHTENGHLPICLYTFQEEGSSSTPGRAGSVLPCLLACRCAN